MDPESPYAPRPEWSENARDAFDRIVSENPAMSASTATSLAAAIDLLDAADVMQLRVNEDGLVQAGSQGQPVAHPLLAEIRLNRTQYLAALRALGLASRSAASGAGSALANKRWAKQAAGANVTPIDPRFSGAAI